ncbi:hypothetical protein TNCV_4780811 [Trichonephila clavipes]|nr:hypothetical protein TNCV_4780811 [Trichonephila clavipes]
MDEHIEMYEKEQDFEEFGSLNPVQSEDRMTAGNLTEDSRSISRDAPGGASAPTSSVPEGTDCTIVQYYPAKLLESLKSDFRFLFPTQKNTGSALCTAAWFV